MTIFLQVMGEFAKLDVFSGEDYYEAIFNFKETESINYKFVQFGSDNMIMMLNSGSVFIMMIILLVLSLVYIFLHMSAVKFAEFETMQALGMSLEEKKDFGYTKSSGEKLVIESYFDLSLAININIYGWNFYNLEYA